MGSGQNIRDSSYGFHTMELVVKYKLVPDVTSYNPYLNSVPGSSNSISTNVPTQSNPQTVQN
jgi:hypothetical protein